MDIKKINLEFELVSKEYLKKLNIKSYIFKPAKINNRLNSYKQSYKKQREFNFLKPVLWNYIPKVNITKVDKIIEQKFSGILVNQQYKEGKIYKMNKEEKLKRQLLQMKKGIIDINDVNF